MGSFEERRERRKGKRKKRKEKYPLHFLDGAALRRGRVSGVGKWLVGMEAPHLQSSGQAALSLVTPFFCREFKWKLPRVRWSHSWRGGKDYLHNPACIHFPQHPLYRGAKSAGPRTNRAVSPGLSLQERGVCIRVALRAGGSGHHWSSGVGINFSY